MYNILCGTTVKADTPSHALTKIELEGGLVEMISEADPVIKCVNIEDMWTNGEAIGVAFVLFLVGIVVGLYAMNY